MANCIPPRGPMLLRCRQCSSWRLYMPAIRQAGRHRMPDLGPKLVCERCGGHELSLTHLPSPNALWQLLSKR